MLWETLSAARDLGRLNEVASVAVRYGFGDLVRRIGLAGALERAGHLQRAITARVDAGGFVVIPEDAGRHGEVLKR